MKRHGPAKSEDHLCEAIRVPNLVDTLLLEPLSFVCGGVVHAARKAVNTSTEGLTTIKERTTDAGIRAEAVKTILIGIFSRT